MTKSDEITVSELIDFQKNVIAEVGLDNREELRREAWKWVLENDINPRHLENTLVRYNANFSPAAGSNPLALGEDPPEDLDY